MLQTFGGSMGQIGCLTITAWRPEVWFEGSRCLSEMVLTLCWSAREHNPMAVLPPRQRGSSIP